jgi:osmotically-inducible protein OsmY
MNKSKIVLRCFVLLILITLVACASTRTHESTGEYIDDSVITTKVKTLLASDDFFKSFQIGVETYKGIVQLSGFVNSQQAVDKASQIARSVQGVNSVKNNLLVK